MIDKIKVKCFIMMFWGYENFYILLCMYY